MTTTTTWTDRYITAVLKGIPEEQRADVNGKLRQLIDRSVLERMSLGEDPGTAERVVLLAVRSRVYQ